MDLGKTAHKLDLIKIISSDIFGAMPDTSAMIVVMDWILCSRTLFESMDERVEEVSRNIGRSICT